jgi:capsular polysaccharide biosynthesis protein/Mrp family chromosome partitioning ATPase
VSGLRRDLADHMGRSGDASVELRQYGEVFRRRWPLVVLGIIVGVAVAVGAIFALPKSYESTASVLVAPTGAAGAVENGRTTSSLNLDTEAQIVKSSVVAKLAAGDLGTSVTPRALVKSVQVTVPPNTSVLDITFIASTPERARDGARAFAEAYLKNRQDLAQARIDDQREAVQKRIDTLGDQLLKIGELIATLPAGSAQRAYQDSRRDLLVRQIAAINEQFVEIDSSESTPGDIITDPQVPTAPSEPNVTILLASGVLAGLLLGVALAFLFDRRDRRIRDRWDLERLGLDSLVPSVIVPPAGLIASPLNTHYHAESMRMLRNALLAQMPGHRGSVMVAAASSGSEGSAVALNLAATLARSGLEVIFASADSEIGDHRMSAAPYGGLADVIHERVSLDDVLHTVDGEPGLRTLSPGMDGSLYSELVQSERLQSVLAALSSRADILVVDVAPVSENADAQTLAAQFDGVVLVAAAKRTTVDEMAEAVDQLRHVSARLFGAVLAQQRTHGAGTHGTATHTTGATGTGARASASDGGRGASQPDKTSSA